MMHLCQVLVSKYPKTRQDSFRSTGVYILQHTFFKTIYIGLFSIFYDKIVLTCNLLVV